MSAPETQTRNGRKQAAAKARRGDPARIVAVLREFSVGQFGARVDLAEYAGTPLQDVARAVNATADHVEAEIREARQRIELVTSGVDEAIEAMVRLVIQGDLSGTLRLGVDDA